MKTRSIMLRDYRMEYCQTLPPENSKKMLLPLRSNQLPTPHAQNFFLPNLDYDILIFQASTSRAGKSINDEAVFIKKFPRYEDVFCLGVEERSRSLKMDNALPVNMTDTIGGNNLENFQRSEFGLIILKIYLC